MAEHWEPLPVVFGRPGSEQQSRSRLDASRSKSQQNLQQLITARRPRSTQSLVRRDSFASESSTSTLDFEQWRPLIARPLALWEKDIQQDSIQRNGGEFCHDCRELNIEKWIGKKMKRQLTIGRWRDICEDCPFCRLVIDCVLQSGERVEDHKYILLDNELSWRLCVVYSRYDGKSIEGYSNARDLRATAKETNGKNAYRFVVCLGSATPLGQIQYIANADPVMERKFFGRKVDQRFANLKLIRQWLPRCQRIHGRSCEESGEAAKRLPMIRVIDVHERIVITAPEGCRYVTLSYVWGNCQHWKASEANVYRDRFGRERIDLPEHLPQTLEDAIYVTRELGERYLWVDALCIIQDRRSEKHAQILRMDAIYSSSVLTIAAASGPNANSGLAGISRLRRVPQRTELVDGLRFSLPLPDYMSLEDDNSLIWNTRGWTFQEKILSKRILLFTDYQVYFQCSNTVFCEDTAMETDRCSASTNKKWRPLRWAGDRLMGEQTDQAGANLSNYMSVVREYTKRTITDPCDGVDAIQGVLGTMQFEMGAFHHGMPVDYFGPALLWQPPLGSTAHRLLSDHAPFPSWSWARWSLPKGVVWQSAQLATTYLTHVAFLLYSNGVDYVSFRELCAPAEDHISRWGLFRSRPKYVRRLPEGVRPPQVYLSPKEGDLLRKIGCMIYIKSEPVKVQIGKEVIWRPQKSGLPSDRYCHYQLVDKRGFCLGDIRMPANARATRGNDPVEFITICVGSGYNGAPIAKKYIPTTTVTIEDSTQTVDMAPSEFPIANVVLVKWVGKVAQRVALGTIVRTAWIKHKRRAEWVLFG